ADRQRDDLDAQDDVARLGHRRHRPAVRGPADLRAELQADPAADRGLLLVPGVHHAALDRPVLHRAPLRSRPSPQRAAGLLAAGVLAPVQRWRRRAAGGVMAEPMVRAESVHKSFGALEVLKGITLTVAAGEVMCLLGPSGSGKSTFLRCINHLERINAGRLYVDGELVGYRQVGDKLHELRESEVAKTRAE